MKGRVASIPSAPEKRMLLCVHWRSPAELRSAGWKVWPKPPSQMFRMSSLGFTRVVSAHRTSSTL